MAKLFYQGHGSFRITTNRGTVLYVDPFAGEGYDLPADLILVSHEHYDHTATDKMPHSDSCKVYRAADFLQDRIYKHVTHLDIECQSVKACNVNHPESECVGFLLSFDGITVYASGDTSETDHMGTIVRDAHPDYALFCGDGIYNMDIPEATRCANIVSAKHSIPIHLLPGSLFSEERAAVFEGPGKIIIRPGETLELI